MWFKIHTWEWKKSLIAVATALAIAIALALPNGLSGWHQDHKSDKKTSKTFVSLVRAEQENREQSPATPYNTGSTLNR